jgi:two-component system alkaline phosphatase synthesis response regulator PhoP
MLYTLETAGFEARGADDGDGLMEMLSSGTPDLIMLDIMLPGKSGIEILKELKKDKRTSGIPVIMATAKGAEYDKVTGLDLGADDYMVKPFGMMEMVSRVRAVLRRYEQGHDEGTLCAGDIELDLSAHRVTVAGKETELTLKEFELLKLFLENPSVVFSREEILNMVWGIDFYGETRTVDVHVGTLRSKLGKSGELIETVRGVGYKLEVNR